MRATGPWSCRPRPPIGARQVRRREEPSSCGYLKLTGGNGRDGTPRGANRPGGAHAQAHQPPVRAAACARASSACAGCAEWRDIHTQLHTVVAEHKRRLNASPANYEQVPSVPAGGPVGQHRAARPSDEGAQGEYLGARGIKFCRHPGRAPVQEAGRWLVAAELVETTRLFGRGSGGIEPQWLRAGGRPLAQEAAAGPALEKKAGEVMALERATLYGHGRLQRPAGELRPRWTRRPRARSSSARRWWPASGKRSCHSGGQPEADRARWKNWSTRRAGRTCWWTTS